MKIMAMSDIHSDFETFDKALEVLVKASDAEVLAITGDLNGNHFNGEEGKQFSEAYLSIRDNIIPQLRERFQKSDGSPLNCNDTANLIYSGQVKINDGVKKMAEDYLRLEEKSKKNMLETYAEFESRFIELEKLGRRIVLIPGNWDGKCIDDKLAKWNLHERYPEEIDGVKFAGFGGASQRPFELPENLAIDYTPRLAFEHLTKEHNEAEVVLMHTPPTYFEGEDALYPGEPLMLAYLYRNSPDLILCGHSHRQIFMDEKTKGTFVVNPGNLGRYKNTNFGTFLEIEIDKSGIKSRRYFNVSGNSAPVKQSSQ